MESLPNELTKEIVSHMPYESVVYMCQTDQHFNTLCQSNNFWEQLYMRDYGVYHAK
jgi:ADP-heptose:LPS heptosyltransferase